MNFAASFHAIALAATERLFFSAVAGTLLAVGVWFLLQLLPVRDSRTNFAVWFSTLLATALLPLLSLGSSKVSVENSHSLVVVSASWAWYAFLIWAAVATCGLARVALATFQVRRLRAEAVAIETDSLPADLRLLIEEFRRTRPVAIMVSRRLEVPTAIGFHYPAIILPAWLLESTPAEALKYILLHELAHLRRRDDWTNLAQKVLKALFFFLPSVWWIERRLSRDREMACDDAVLAHSGTPLAYAECLAHVAERSFLRRQLALAQAAVGRMRQLTARVAMILDPNRPRATQMWKPAIPVVIAMAALCTLPASFTPELISFADHTSLTPAASGTLGATTSNSTTSNPTIVHPLRVQPVHLVADGSGVHAVPASLRTDSGAVAPLSTKAANSSRGGTQRSHRTAARKSAQPDILIAKLQPPAILTAKLQPPAILTAKLQPPMEEQYVTVREEMFFVVTERTPSGEQQSWQMHVVQISVQPQGKPVAKPRKI